MPIASFTLAKNIGQRLTQKGAMLTVAESCTGGGLAYAITQVPGSSAWFQMGWVTYSNTAKVAQLGLDPARLLKTGAVGSDTVSAMAQQALKRASGATWALAVTGIAGPGALNLENPQENVAVGEVWCAVANTDPAVWVLNQHFAGSRRQIQRQAIHFALTLLWLILKTGQAPTAL